MVSSARAVVLTQFNWARGYSEGGEVEAKYTNGNFYAYANFAVNVTRAIGPEIEPVPARRRRVQLPANARALHR